MKAAAYCRVSTDEQRERQTIENQIELLTSHASKANIMIHDLYLDDGITGTIALGNRPEGRRLLADARAGCFEMVIVKQVDRLGRDAVHILTAVNELAALGVGVASVMEAMDFATPQGKFMLTVHSGVAALERDTIIQRSVEGTNRLAREGVWLGGIVPYGYRVSGRDRNARLVVSNEPIPGLELSEAEVVRLVYRMVGEEKQSCYTVAAQLETLGVPPAYTRDARGISHGKRTEATSGIWRPSRVRNMLTNTTYKGIHQYGKRSRRRRDIIEREVPAIVSEDLWARTQETLHRNQIFSTKNAKHQYLLRGLIKCGLCGLTMCGTTSGREGSRTYYVCNGKKAARGTYGNRGQRCPSKSIAGHIEDIIWDDIEAFLRRPGAVVDQLESRLAARGGEERDIRARVRSLETALRMKETERDKVVTLYRRDRLSEADLDRQLDAIGREEQQTRDQLARLTVQLDAADEASRYVRSACDLLTELQMRLDTRLDYNTKRAIVEALVESMTVYPPHTEGSSPRVDVVYRFDHRSAVTRTDRDSWPQRA